MTRRFCLPVFLLLIVLLSTVIGAQEKKLNWSVRTADSFIKKFPDPDSIHWVGQTNHFSWQAGYVMFAMEKMWRATRDIKYYNYIKKYVDQQVDESGNIPGFSPTALDNFLPGYAIIFMFEQTHLEKYKIATKKIRDTFINYPRNSDGGFWHGSWANKNTGLASEVWSEGLGWFALLIADVFEYLPQDHRDYNYLLSILRNLCKGLKNVQDVNTGMWCQVVDKPKLPDNWNETSGTGMYLYLIKKSIEKGYISKKEFNPVVKKAYQGIIKKANINSNDLVDIYNCSSIGIMDDYKMYVSQPKEVNTFAGVTSFIIGTLSMEGLYK